MFVKTVFAIIKTVAVNSAVLTLSLADADAVRQNETNVN